MPAPAPAARTPRGAARPAPCPADPGWRCRPGARPHPPRPGPCGKAPGGGGPAGALPCRPRAVPSSGGKAATDSPEARVEEQVFFLTHAVTVIGRGVDADLRLNDPGVSRRHAELRLEGEAIVLVDTGSTNGVRVNEVATTRRQLAPGDRVEMGSTVLIYQHGEG